jgi:acetoin utilization deacetylase AcuC-like enzyme
VVWHLLDQRLARDADVHTPTRARYDELVRVHDPAYLEQLTHPDTLARIFAVPPGEIVVDEVMSTLRLVVGGTIAAARAAHRDGGAAFNLMGGFHHAAPAAGGGLCALDDVAVAIAALRADGFHGQVTVLDLDAHPPDGLAACVARDTHVRIGSISGSDWGPLPSGVDETVLPDADDARYLGALEALLERTPRGELVFVIAGGDVLRGDRLGKLALTLEGTRARDLRVVEWLERTPSVWLPAGGYAEDSWRVLVGSYLAVTRHTRRPVRAQDPMQSRFAAIARGLRPELLSGGADDWSDVEADLLGRPPTSPRLLGYYTREGLEYALAEYGFITHVHRLGYGELRIEIEPPDEVGQRVTAHGDADGRSHLLIDLIVGRAVVDGEPSLVVHWLSLRNPRAAFTADRPALPGQEVPGLGMSRDMGQLLGRMAERLGMASVSFRPAYVHTAYAARNHFHFADPARQLRFLALLSDLGERPIGELTRALSAGRILMDGAPYAWEADLMMYRPRDPPPSLALPAGPRPHFSLAG